MNHGYVDIQVAAPQVDYSEDGITVTFTINEGIRYKLGEIGFKGDLIDNDERLKEVIKLDDYKDSNGYFSLTVLQDDIKALTDFYGNYATPSPRSMWTPRKVPRRASLTSSMCRTRSRRCISAAWSRRATPVPRQRHQDARSGAVCLNIDASKAGQTISAAELAEMDKSDNFGDVVGVGAGRNWAHVNSVDYDPTDDSIIIRPATSPPPSRLAAIRK